MKTKAMKASPKRLCGALLLLGTTINCHIGAFTDHY
jgi:hypothetical protein